MQDSEMTLWLIVLVSFDWGASFIIYPMADNDSKMLNHKLSDILKIWLSYLIF